ncbi:aminotransferase class V-fold PLP-dependent enzyme [Pleurocapsa sp. FMAR1]|uniref:aminotransferase class V-fold PLP-dependent enzyme n=1 Tax=Pleurocapsa sp. FMAR1 TaxID=3040204 RepID=UPI0029C830D9|nr:aminotransferase class V-fold PLP-dependent enzyme [Pleurocapsa sp. FMAR1]
MNISDRALFDIPREIVYLNSASIAPRLKQVSKAGHQGIDIFSSPWSITSDDRFRNPEILREEFARFIEVDADTVALVPSASYGIAVAAKNIPIEANANIVVLEDQYPSNIYAWRRRADESRAMIRVAQRRTNNSLTESVLNLIDSNTAVVTIPNCHWTDGELLDLVAVGEAARTAGAALVVDASQSLGALPINFDVVQPDFVVSVGHKWLLGSYGLGYLYVDKKWHSCGIPIEESSLTRRGSEDSSQLANYVDEYRPGARRFDFGEFTQFISIPMAIAAISQLNRWGSLYVQKELFSRTQHIRAICNRLGIETLPTERSAGHIVGIKLNAEQQPMKLAAVLKSANIYISVRSETIRVAPHLHTDEQDIKRFGSVLKEYLV